jgi:hypothetical protein
MSGREFFQRRHRGAEDRLSNLVPLKIVGDYGANLVLNPMIRQRREINASETVIDSRPAP